MVRAVLPAHVEQLQRTLGLAAGALTSAHPEEAVGYLQLLDEHLQRALRAVQ